MSRSCPRCGGAVRPPDLMDSAWRCARCGPVYPVHTPDRVSLEVLAAIRDRVVATDRRIPMWCPWPLPTAWTVTGLAWAGDERDGPRATAVALSGPAPLNEGPADAVFVAEEPGVGFGMGLAGLPGADPGESMRPAAGFAHAKVRANGHPTPLWSVESLEDRSAFAGEAKGVWLIVVVWPATAGYLLDEPITLHDLVDSVPGELVFGAPSRPLRAH